MELPRRKQMRLKEYDYAQNGGYYVTICTKDRRSILSTICRGDPCGRPMVALQELGQIAEKAFVRVEELYAVQFDYHVIMPDHIHFIVFLPAGDGLDREKELGRIVGAYKSIISTEWLKVCKSKGILMDELWQRNYFEHVIRNEQDLYETRRYIENNPAKWLLQKYGKA